MAKPHPAGNRWTWRMICAAGRSLVHAAAPCLLRELVDLVDWLDANQRTFEGEFSMDEILSGPRAAISRAKDQPHER